ncbi:MAG TPA: RsmE family RNA methyltransferase [Candidatus Dormibacteraeota bacterium]|nr:RsmE family RNA methyltransferase [Candidatus Dormibacteraeota bacterium]
MPAFFARREGDRVFIVGADAAHIARSLRAKPGEEIQVVDPGGFLLTVRLDSVSPATVEGTVAAATAHQPEPRARVTIAIANLPAPALDLVLSRCTEAGAHAFVVFQADRSVGRGEKLQRWNAIAREAAMLAGRLRVPEVSAASSFEAAFGAAENPVLLDRHAPRRLAEITEPADVTLFVGPEGGWTEREVGMAEVTASLGPRNLRADTAALIAVAVALSVRGG